MKGLLFAAAVVTTASFTAPVSATDVGVSITIGQPDFYGRIDIGDYPRPQLVYAQPILIERIQPRPPIYLRVPPGHAKHWGKHCREYNACGEQVYFVQDSWYTNEYIPYYQERQRKDHDKHDDNRRGDDNDNDQGNKHGNKNGKH